MDTRFNMFKQICKLQYMTLFCINRSGLLCMGIHIFSLVILSLILNLKEGVAGEDRVFVSGPLTVKLYYVPPYKPLEVSGVPIEVSAGTKRLFASLEGKDAQLAIRSEVILRAELKGVVTPMIEVIEEGRSYMIRLDMTKMQRPTKLTGQFDSQTKKEIVSDEIKVKKFLRSWSVSIGPEELAEIKETENKSEAYFFHEAFHGLARLKRVRPEEPKVEVSVTSSDCFELNVEFLNAQQDYLELEATIPFAQQFEVMTRTMLEIQDALAATGKDLGDAEGEMDKFFDGTPLEEKLKEYIEKSRGLSQKLTESLEGIKETIKEEHEAIIEATRTFSEPLEKVKDGLGKAQKTMEKVNTAVKEINSYIATAKIMVDARNMSGPNTIKAFGDFFGEITDKLDPLLKTIPVIGVFLDIYAQAIQQIAISAEKIEEVVNDRNQLAALMRATGDPWFRNPYIILNTEQERLKKKRSELFNRTQILKNKLARECRVEVPWLEEYDHYDEIEDATIMAEEVCENAFEKVFVDLKKELDINALDRIDLNSKIDAIYKDVYIKYKKKKRKMEKQKITRDGYDNLLAGYREMLARQDKLKKKQDLTVNERDELNYSLNQKINDTRRKLIFWKANIQEFNEVKKKLKRYEEAKKKIEGLKAKIKECKRNYIKTLAKEKGWKMSTIKVIHFDLFRYK